MARESQLKRKGPTLLQPQEIETFFIIPALRKELAKKLVKEKHLTQKRVAKLLGVSEAAVSQYLKDKRGDEVDLSTPEIQEALNSAVEIVAEHGIENPLVMIKVIQELTKIVKDLKILCDVHKKYGAVDDDCNVCNENIIKLTIKKME